VNVGARDRDNLAALVIPRVVVGRHRIPVATQRGCCLFLEM
jgi:hypothetical protein